MPEIKMPPPPPPPAPMDTPEIAEAELDSPAPQAQENTGSKRKYRKMNRGAGKAGGAKGYKGGGLSGL